MARPLLPLRDLEPRRETRSAYVDGWRHDDDLDDPGHLPDDLEVIEQIIDDLVDATFRSVRNFLAPRQQQANDPFRSPGGRPTGWRALAKSKGFLRPVHIHLVGLVFPDDGDTEVALGDDCAGCVQSVGEKFAMHEVFWLLANNSEEMTFCQSKKPLSGRF